MCERETESVNLEVACLRLADGLRVTQPLVGEG